MSHIWTWLCIICGAQVAHAFGAPKDAVSVAIVASGITLAGHRLLVWLNEPRSCKRRTLSDIRRGQC